MQLRFEDLGISVHRPPPCTFPTNPKFLCGDRLARYISGSTDMLMNDYYEVVHVGLDDGSYLTIKRHLTDDEFANLKERKE